MKALRFARTEQILQFFVEVVEENGLTFEQRLLGATGIDTVDPRNVEAVLSSNFTGKIDQYFFFVPLGDSSSSA